ncbi:MAG: hypothetical protein HKP12_14085 [Gammaproteobacteria bacterium]|nr:hypothetical protein [Gammaproteobacteria bacterium]
MYKMQNTRTNSVEKSSNKFVFPDHSALFDENPQRLGTFLRSGTRDTDSRQYMDNANDVRPVRQYVEADSPGAQPVKIVVNNQLRQQSLKNSRGEPVATGESGNKQKANSHTQKDKKGCPDNDQKKLRAAEARHRLELLEEERELQDNLAEFWDSRFDKPRRCRLPQET